jgi:hypothetical protein
LPRAAAPPPWGDPRIALTWLANELRVHGPGLAAGDLIDNSRGTCIVPAAAAPGQRFTADYGPLGTLELSFEQTCSRLPIGAHRMAGGWRAQRAAHQTRRAPCSMTPAIQRQHIEARQLLVALLHASSSLAASAWASRRARAYPTRRHHLACLSAIGQLHARGGFAPIMLVGGQRCVHVAALCQDADASTRASMIALRTRHRQAERIHRMGGIAQQGAAPEEPSPAACGSISAMG